MGYKINHNPPSPQRVRNGDFATIVTTLTWDADDIPPSVTDILVFTLIEDQSALDGEVTPGNDSASFPYEVRMMQGSLDTQMRIARFQSVFIAKSVGNVALTGCLSGEAEATSLYSFNIVDISNI